MKRISNIIFLLTMAAVMAFDSCSKLKQEYNTPAEMSVKPIATQHTKSIIEGTSYPEEETLGLWAFHTEKVAGTSWAAGKDAAKAYLDNVAFHKNIGSWAGYDYDAMTHKPYYWPTYGSMFYAAYSPYSLHDKVSYSKETGAVTLSEYTLDSDNYQDFLYAEIADLDNSVFKAEKSIIFKHGLALIEFTAQLKNDDAQNYIDIHSITTLPVASTGSFTSRDAVTQKPKWVRNATPQIVLPICDAGETAGVDNGFSLTADSKTKLGNALVIPGNAVQIEICYRLQYSEGQFLTEKYVVVPTDAIAVWEPGKKYSYHITLGVDYIMVEPSIVVDWNEIS